MANAYRNWIFKRVVNDRNLVLTVSEAFFSLHLIHSLSLHSIVMLFYVVVVVAVVVVEQRQESVTMEVVLLRGGRRKIRFVEDESNKQTRLFSGKVELQIFIYCLLFVFNMILSLT